MLGRGVSKPVILTGSQVPLSKTRNDALRNLITSVTIAATQSIPEVLLFFNDVLLRGNRSVKVSASAFPAFYSPNCSPLGKVGIEVSVRKALVLAASDPGHSLDHAGNLEAAAAKIETAKAAFDDFSVITVVLRPGIQASTVRAMLEHTTPKVKGVILMAFGAGNAPADDELIGSLKYAHDRHGAVIVDITQIVSGAVDLDAYESASGLRYAGAVSGYDLTAEAALTKLICLIGMGLSQAEVEEAMVNPFQGDLTHEVRETTDNSWGRIFDRRGHGARVLRLIEKLGKKP